MSELHDWETYFDLYGFTPDREDRRAALLASVIVNISGKTAKQPVSDEVFLKMLQPFADTVSVETATTKSVEQQHAEFRAFTARFRSLQQEVRGGQRAP